MPKVSVIVPVYNAEKYIASCLDSLIHQTLADIEIICIDNASIDDTSTLLRKYALRDERIKVITQSRNRGQANSINKGVMASTGEYIAECDADDIPEPNMYEKLYEERQGSDVVQCGFFYEFPKRTISRIPWGTARTINPLVALKGRQLFRFLSFQPHIMSAIYKRDFILENDLLYREGYDFEDTSLSFKIRTTAKRYRMIPDMLYHYRQINPQSGTATIDNMTGVFDQYAEIERWNKEHGLGLERYIAVMKYYTYDWSARRAKTDEDAKEFWEKASAEFKRDDADLSLFYENFDIDNYLYIKGMNP